jgi:6-phosphogluconolactonase
MSVTVFPDIEALSRAAAEFFVKQAQEAISRNGRFTVALAGGNTPKRLYELLASDPYRDYVEWEKVWAFFGDERWVPLTDPASNERTARESLLSKVAIPHGQVFPMFVQGLDADAGAKLYEQRLQELLGLKCCFDLALLGMGDDGHTASLFPGIPELGEQLRWVVPTISPKGVPQRISLTYPALLHVHTLLFLVAGEDKAEPMARALGDDDSVRPPSGVLAKQADRAVWYADTKAAALL